MPTYLEQTGAEVQEILNRPEIKRNSQLINDEGYINREEDPTVPSWSKQPNKPTYTAEEVGAMPADAAFKTINGESVKGSGNINTDAIEIQNSPRLVATGDVFDEYFGASAYDLLKRGICGFSGDSEEDFKYIYYKVSGTYPLEDLGGGPTVVFDDGTTRSTITTRDEDGTIYIDALSEESSKVELQQSLTPGSTTKAPSVTAVKNRIEPIEAKIPAEASSSNKLTDKAYVDGKVAVVDEKVGDIEDIIPDQASESNKLADKAFVNSSVQTATANFRGNWETIDDVPIHASEYPADYAGGHTPTVNDYLVVRDMEDIQEWTYGETYSTGAVVMYQDYAYICIYDDGVGAFTSFLPPDEETDKWQQWMFWEQLEGTWRFKYSGNWDTMGKAGWLPEYQVNEEPFTMAQLAAINSGITSSKVSQYDGYAQSKQDKLIDELNIKSVNGQAIMGSGTLPLLNQSLNEMEITDVEHRVIYQAFVGGPSLICAGLSLDESLNFYVFNPSDYPCELDLYASRDDPEASVILTMEPFEWMEISGSNVEGSIDWDVVYRSNVTKEVFWAIYGTTTAAEILAASQAGKDVMCVYGNRIYRLANCSGTHYHFVLLWGGWYYYLTISVSSNTWSYGTSEVQTANYRTSTIIGNESSTTYYPNTKAVADYIGTSKNVFVATMGVTTLEEINAAYNSGKAIVVVGNSNRVYILAARTNDNYFFTAVYSNYLYRLALSISNGQWWGPSSYLLQIASDRQTTDPTAADLDSTTKYPAMVVMKNYINSQLQGALDESYPRAIAQINALYPED